GSPYPRRPARGRRTRRSPSAAVRRAARTRTGGRVRARRSPRPSGTPWSGTAVARRARRPSCPATGTSRAATSAARSRRRGGVRTPRRASRWSGRGPKSSVPSGTCTIRYMSEARAKLLDAAIERIAHHGGADRSLRSLAADLGTSHRMLIYHFGSKEGLLTAVAREVEARQRVALADIDD